MIRRSTPARACTSLALLLLHLLVGLVVPYVHARAEAEELAQQTHIEAASTESCVPHDDLQCQVCRGMQSQFTVVPAIATPAATDISPTPQTSPETIRSVVFCHGALGSRAPPTV